MKHELGGYMGSFFTAILAAVQTNQVLQIIEVILACISFLLSIAYTIWKWYKKAKSEQSDGGSEVTYKEVKELQDEIMKEVKKNGDSD